MKTLLAVHGIEQSIDAMKTVINLAKEADAHLNIVLLGHMRSVAVPASPGVPPYYFNEMNADLIKEGENQVRKVNKLLQSENLSATVTLECRDPALIEQTLLEHAMFSDATIFLNQTVPSSEITTRAFNGALLDSGTPVIVLGANADKMPDIKKVMYAWNGEPQAAKAVHQSLPWLNGATEAHVVVVDPGDNTEDPNPGDNIAAYLARQNLAVTVDRLSGGRRKVSEVLIEHATDIEADLIVMGGYSHSRLREWLIGGTTRDILKEAKLPVLMAH